MYRYSRTVVLPDTVVERFSLAEWERLLRERGYLAEDEHLADYAQVMEHLSGVSAVDDGYLLGSYGLMAVKVKEEVKHHNIAECGHREKENSMAYKCTEPSCHNYYKRPARNGDPK